MGTVMIVDDHALIRDGLRRAFERAEDFDVVGEAGSLAEARALLAKVQPDVLVLDIRLPDGDGLSWCKEVRDHDPGLAVVILTMYAGDQRLLDARDAGASAFVSKDAPAREVVATARDALARPDEFVASGLADALARTDSLHRPTLTARETEVLGLLAEGLGVAAISRRLYISESTAKTHVGKIYAKLGASNRAQALMTAVRLGLVDQSSL